MILEHARLDVQVGQQDAFEAAFSQAIPLIMGAPGFRSLRLLRCVEIEHNYLLLVQWDSIADHEQGFRGSAAYQEWKALLHHFYDPFPVVEHYRPLFFTQPDILE
jgi:heme-degrading monooxygenase HmoA